VVIVRLFDEEKPLTREQLRVNLKDDCGGRLFPTITKLNTWGELAGDEGRDRERGDNDTDDNTIESSSTDHRTSPLDPMSTLPKIFNFDDGFIFDPDNTSNFTSGDWAASIGIRMTLSQLLGSPDIEDFPVITIWNTSPTTNKEELEVTFTVEKDKVEEKMREGQEPR
jgi:hypothetical protein